VSLYECRTSNRLSSFSLMFLAMQGPFECCTPAFGAQPWAMVICSLGIGLSHSCQSRGFNLRGVQSLAMYVAIQVINAAKCRTAARIGQVLAYKHVHNAWIRLILAVRTYILKLWAFQMWAVRATPTTWESHNGNTEAHVFSCFYRFGSFSK